MNRSPEASDEHAAWRMGGRHLFLNQPSMPSAGRRTKRAICEDLHGLIIRYLLSGVLLLGVLVPVYADAAPDSQNMQNGSANPESTRQKPSTGTEQNGYGAILDRLSEENQTGFLTSLRRINTGLQKAYASLAKNYTAYRVNYERTKTDIQNRRSTPNYIFKNMQNLEAEKERIEAGIKLMEDEKKALEVEVRSFYQGKMPQEFTREWEREEEQYADYLNAIYRQVGWWMQIENSQQWRNDEGQLWDYLRKYYQDHPEELHILK
jgi:septal ring factor EnvC (AmiA/AmiB activator)